MRNLVKTTKLFLITLLIFCFQKPVLFAVLSLQELTARRIAESIDVDEFVGGLISGDSDALGFLEDVCNTQGERQGFAAGLLPDFFVQHKIFVGHKSSVYSVSWSPDGKNIASVSGDNTVRVWNVETGECIRTFAGHTHSVLSVAWSPDGKNIRPLLKL